jgi:phage host-nuclease inhibitor protein Gam
VAQVVEMGSLGDVQSTLAAQVEEMRARTAAQEDGYCATIADLQEQVRPCEHGVQTVYDCLPDLHEPYP